MLRLERNRDMSTLACKSAVSLQYSPGGLAASCHDRYYRSVLRLPAADAREAETIGVFREVASAMSRGHLSRCDTCCSEAMCSRAHPGIPCARRGRIKVVCEALFVFRRHVRVQRADRRL